MNREPIPRGRVASIRAALLGLVALATGLEGQAPPREHLRISTDREQLSPVGWLAVSTKGILALSQPDDGTLLFYGATGRRLGAFGRRGEGPGEFRYPVRGGWVGDTLWVADGALRRITLVGPDRRLLRSIPLPGSVVGTSRSIERLLGLLPSDTLLAGTAAPGGPGPNRIRGVEALDRQGRSLRHLATIPAACAKTFALPGGGSGGVAIPYCTAPLEAVAEDGRRVATLIADNFAAGPVPVTLTVIGIRGDTLLSHRMSVPGIPLTARTQDSVRKQIMAGLRPEAAAVMRTLAFPRWIPPVAQLVLADDGTIWLGMSSLTDVREWRVLDTKGRLVRRLTLPRAFRLASTRGGVLTGLLPTEDGDWDVVVYKP